MKKITIPKSIFSEVYLGVKNILTSESPSISQTKFNGLLHKELTELTSNFEFITYGKSDKYCYNHYIVKKDRININFGVFFLLITILAKENNVPFTETNFKEGFRNVFEILNITLEQITKIELQYKEHSFSQSEEKRYALYRCYYYFSEETDTVSFFTKINFKDKYVTTIETQSGHDFSGDMWMETITVGTSLLLKNVHEENKRVLLILLSDGQKDFSDRELSIGLFLNINPVMQPEGGVIIFQKIGENLTQKSTHDLIDKHKAKSIPELIRFYLEKKEYRMVDNDLITLKSLEQRLNNRYPYWPNFKKIIKRVTGIYKCFTIGRDGNIDTHYFLFRDDGSLRCHTNDLNYYYGHIKIESFKTILLSMKAGSEQSYYKIFINRPKKLREEKIQKLRAVYAGIAGDSQPKGGRCYFVRMTETELKEAIERCLQENNEFCSNINNRTDKNSVDKIYKELDNSQYEILFESLQLQEGKDVSKLESQDIELIDFLSGADDTQQLTEDGGNLLIENIRFPNSNRELLAELSGVYEYYRTSGYKKNAFIKKYSLRIDTKGKVTVYGNYPSIGQGLVYNNYLFIHLFNTEKYAKINASPNHNLKKYDGVAVFKINKKLSKPMLGVYQSFNADGMMVVGRIILTRSKTDIVGEQDSYQIRTPKFDLLDTETNGIASFLTGRVNNLVSYSRENLNEVRQGKRLIKGLDIGSHLFDSACWKAINKDNDNALETLKHAILNGFNDEERFSKEVTEGAFKHIKKIAIDEWDSHIPD